MYFIYYTTDTGISCKYHGMTKSQLNIFYLNKIIILSIPKFEQAILYLS